MKNQNIVESKIILFLSMLKSDCINRRKINTSDLCGKFKIGKQYSTVAKNIGIITQIDKGFWKWNNDADVDINLVRKLNKAVKEYSHTKKYARNSYTEPKENNSINELSRKIDLILNFLNIKP